MKRGEIWWANFPEPAGRRPAMLLSRDAAYGIRTKVTVAEVTRTIRGIESEVTLGRIEGLSVKCVANVDNVVTVPKSWLDTRIGSLPRAKIRRLDAAICFSLGVMTAESGD